ncbi:MAG: hypothetical protein ED859_11635 [Desulfuromonadales bacterium]|nr:MAG: hypothetical protein ED859_11635 [Desulfuromonadales bacterium]
MREDPAFSNVGFTSFNFFKEVKSIHNFFRIDLLWKVFEKGFQFRFGDIHFATSDSITFLMVYRNPKP